MGLPLPRLGHTPWQPTARCGHCTGGPEARRLRMAVGDGDISRDELRVEVKEEDGAVGAGAGGGTN